MEKTKEKLRLKQAQEEKSRRSHLVLDPNLEPLDPRLFPHPGYDTGVYKDSESGWTTDGKNWYYDAADPRYTEGGECVEERVKKSEEVSRDSQEKKEEEKRERRQRAVTQQRAEREKRSRKGAEIFDEFAAESSPVKVLYRSLEPTENNERRKNKKVRTDNYAEKKAKEAKDAIHNDGGKITINGQFC